MEIVIGHSLKLTNYARQPKSNEIKIRLAERLNAFDSTW